MSTNTFDGWDARGNTVATPANQEAIDMLDDLLWGKKTVGGRLVTAGRAPADATQTG